MPRYYKLKLYSEDEREYVGYKTRQKMLEEQAKKMLDVDDLDQYYRDLDQKVLASFKRMYKRSEEGRSKI